jgi:hypothetical protein
MKKIKLANNTYVDSRILGISIGCADEEYEYYFPKKAKKERVEQIEKIKKLICEFEKMVTLILLNLQTSDLIVQKKP